MGRWPDRWIVIPNWERFQHYKDRDPRWIKLYRQLRHKPEWIDLSLADKGLLVELWLMYAETSGRLRMSDVTREVTNTRRTPDAHRMFVTRSLTRLNHAGFVEFSASTPLSLSLIDVHARAREQNGRAAPCEFCEIGGGRHAADCPTLKGAQ